MANVLVVDDTAFMRAMLKEILAESGHSVIAEAKDGEEAVKLYKKHFPDVVTMDITMPVMNGLDALQQIMQINPEAAVIMCSAMAQKHMVIEAIQAGARDFIVKPLQKERLVQILSRIV